MAFVMHLRKGINKVDLKKIEDVAASCKLCNLYMGRKNPVFAKGNPNSKIMIIGMVPGPDENEIGIPFVGRSGRLLDKILKAVELTLNELCITNLVKCFLAPGKLLQKEWVETCLPYIISQIVIIQPSVILTLGVDASVTLLGMTSDTRMYSIRGKVFKYGQIDVIPTYHPSYILRQGGIQSDAFRKSIEDFRQAQYIQACPIYGQIEHPKGFKYASSREVDPHLRQMVFERDNWTCQICGKTIDEAQLHCHHMDPATQNPMFQNDMDSCITLCKDCHDWVHSQYGCRYIDLRCENS
jgi:uracil-DNA glycosylase family 4